MANSKNVTNLNLVKNTKKKSSKVSALSPREIVSELDRYVIGQKEAKKAVTASSRCRCVVASRVIQSEGQLRRLGETLAH